MSKTLSERIIDLREALDITQGKLAEEIGVDKSSMSRIEQGTRKVSSDELLKLVNYFQVPTDYILGRTDDLTTPTLLKDQLEHIKIDDLPYYCRVTINSFVEFERYQFHNELRKGRYAPSNLAKRK